jgi:hypothetical protein
MIRPVLACCLLITSACSMQMRAESRAGSASNGSGTAETAKPARPHKSHGKGVSASFHKSGSISGKIDWQGRSGQLCRAAAPFKFVGMAKLAGSAQVTPSGASATGHAEASGKTSGGSSATNCDAPRSPVPATPAATPIKTPEKLEPTQGEGTKLTRPASSEVGKGPPVNLRPVARPSAKPEAGPPKQLKPKPKPQPEPTPTAPSGPTPTQLETPKEPPSEPPPNVFGYDEPVRGCFEGQVFPLAVDAKQLPTDYASLTPVSVVYACEWDIAPRAWDQGFPGIAGRFEWFAIRYAGAFRVADAGDYTFRISSDDGTKVLVDGKQVIANDGQHPPQEARGTVKLAAGDHQMVLEYFQGPRYQINLQLWVTPPGKSEELFTVR